MAADERITRRELNQALSHFVARVSCESADGVDQKYGMARMRFATPHIGPSIASIRDCNAFEVTWTLPRARGMVGYRVTDGPGDTVRLYWRPLRFQRCTFLKEAAPAHSHRYFIGDVGIDSEWDVNDMRTYGVWALNVPPHVRDRAVSLYQAMQNGHVPPL